MTPAPPKPAIPLSALEAVDIRVEAAYFPFAEVSVDILIVYADGRSVQIGSGGLLRPDSRPGIRAIPRRHQGPAAAMLERHPARIHPEKAGHQRCRHDQGGDHRQQIDILVRLLPRLKVEFLAAIIVSLILMASLPWATWERLIIWMVIGIAVYFAYGARHSRLRSETT